MMMQRMDQQLALKRSFEHLVMAYIQEMVVEMGSPDYSSMFAMKGKDDPAAIATEAARRLQALVEPGPDEPVRAGTELGKVLKVHQTQLLSLEDAMVGFLQTGHATVEEVRVKLEKELFVYKPDGGWGRKRMLLMGGWSGDDRYGKWGQGNWGAKFKTQAQARAGGSKSWKEILSQRRIDYGSEEGADPRRGKAKERTNCAEKGVNAALKPIK